MEALSIVATQVVVLFILIFIGVFLAKRNIITEAGTKSMTDFVLCLVTPCLIIKSFIRKFDISTLKYVLLSLLCAFISHIIFIILSTIFFNDKVETRKSVLRFASIFGNCGFMSMPIQEAVLGETGVLCCASFIAAFNFFAWTYGIVQMSGDRKSVSLKKVFINPGVTGIIIGMIVFVFSIPIPNVIYTPISYLAALNTPLPMVIIGYHLSKSNIKSAITDLKCILCCLARIVFFPIIAVAFLYLCGFRDEILISASICCCAPSAAYTTMFSFKYNRDTNLSVNIVSLSTLLSLVTMPLIISLVRAIA